jgi:hypothetical protein
MTRPAWQLSLFPARGFGLLALDELLVASDGLPSFRRSRRAALALLRRSAVGESAWLAAYARVVPVEVHEDSDEEERPCFVIGDGP